MNDKIFVRYELEQYLHTGRRISIGTAKQLVRLIENEPEPVPEETDVMKVVMGARIKDTVRDKNGLFICFDNLSAGFSDRKEGKVIIIRDGNRQIRYALPEELMGWLLSKLENGAVPEG